MSWLPPLGIPYPITNYVVTPYIDNVPQGAIFFSSTATTATVIGLANGIAYTFTVKAINALGNDSASSGASGIVTPTPAATTAVAAGYSHMCALMTGGTVECWGSNVSGALGDGTQNDSPEPVSVSGITTATAITAGNQDTCALLTDGTIECWGDNAFGQLGNGSSNNYSPAPVSVTGITGAIAIAAGHEYTCAVLAAGGVECWGHNSFGQLGNGTTIDSSTPVAVTGITNASRVTAGFDHTCALLTDGTAKCWGHNVHGQLGNGTNTQANAPVAVLNITNATALSAGFDHTCAVLSGGSAECWGYGHFGQLGNGFTTDETVPVNVSGLTTAVAIAGSHSATCAVLTNGTVECWGDNSRGQLGTTLVLGNAVIPVAAQGITTAAAITAGDQEGCSRLTSGTIKCWGQALGLFGPAGILTTIAL